MSIAANDGLDGYRPEIEQWFESALGRILLEQEKRWVSARLETAFGYYLLQLSALVKQDLAQDSHIRHCFQLAPDGALPNCGSALSRYQALPLPSSSVDVVILHHVLEFSQQPHQVLREAHRVLMPQGLLLVICINPWSLFGLRTQVLAKLKSAAWQGRSIGAGRMLDWLSLLDFRASPLHRGFHHIPVQAPKLLQRFNPLWQAAERFSAPGGGVYLIEARKQVTTLTPSKMQRPRWRAWRPDLVPLGAAKGAAKGAANASSYKYDK